MEIKNNTKFVQQIKIEGRIKELDLSVINNKNAFLLHFYSFPKFHLKLYSNFSDGDPSKSSNFLYLPSRPKQGDIFLNRKAVL